MWPRVRVRRRGAHMRKLSQWVHNHFEIVSKSLKNRDFTRNYPNLQCTRIVYPGPKLYKMSSEIIAVKKFRMRLYNNSEPIVVFFRAHWAEILSKVAFLLLCTWFFLRNLIEHWRYESIEKKNLASK